MANVVTTGPIPRYNSFRCNNSRKHDMSSWCCRRCCCCTCGLLQWGSLSWGFHSDTTSWKFSLVASSASPCECGTVSNDHDSPIETAFDDDEDEIGRLIGEEVNTIVSTSLSSAILLLSSIVGCCNFNCFCSSIRIRSNGYSRMSAIAPPMAPDTAWTNGGGAVMGKLSDCEIDDVM